MTEIFDVDGIKMRVSRDHRFGSDAVLLGRFINPRKGDILCDLCTGCGIIPVILSKNRNILRKIYAVDISAEAISLLEETIADNNLDFIKPVLADLRIISNSVGGAESRQADIVSVNPPYFKAGSGKTRASTAQANARHELLCTLEDTVEAAARILKFGGYLKMCHIPERLTDVICVLRSRGLEPKEIVFVYSENKTSPWLFLVSAKKGGKPGLKISSVTGDGGVAEKLS